MYKKGMVKLLNVLIIIAMVVLVYMIVYPNYKSIKRENKIADVKANMHILRAAVENFAAFNDGNYPLSFRDFSKYVDNGILPVNPYSFMPMTDDEIISNIYEDPVGFENDDPDDVNARLEGEPGVIFYSIYPSPGDSSFVIHYSLIGTNEDGKPISYIDPGQKEHIFILNDQQ